MSPSYDGRYISHFSPANLQHKLISQIFPSLYMHLFHSKKTRVHASAPQATAHLPNGPPGGSVVAISRLDDGKSMTSQQPRTVRSAPVSKPVYRPLGRDNKEIRLLDLHAGHGQDQIRCTVRYTQLYTKEQLQYETVSYHWGSSDRDVAVEVNGTAFHTTRNARSVLHRIRRPDKNRLVWIDAICIDQANNSEKNQQVAMMGEIYRSTTRNIIWLGIALDDPARVDKTVRAVLADARKNTGNFKTFYRTTHPNSLKGEPSRDGDVLDGRIDLKPLLDLFSSPWFGRIWVRSILQ